MLDIADKNKRELNRRMIIVLFALSCLLFQTSCSTVKGESEIRTESSFRYRETVHVFSDEEETESDNEADLEYYENADLEITYDIGRSERLKRSEKAFSEAIKERYGRKWQNKGKTKPAKEPGGIIPDKQITNSVDGSRTSNVFDIVSNAIDCSGDMGLCHGKDFGKSKICIRRKKTEKTYDVACVSKNAISILLKRGDVIIPGGSDGYNTYDCDCKEVKQPSPIPIENKNLMVTENEDISGLDVDICLSLELVSSNANNSMLEIGMQSGVSAVSLSCSDLVMASCTMNTTNNTWFCDTVGGEQCLSPVLVIINGSITCSLNSSQLEPVPDDYVRAISNVTCSFERIKAGVYRVVATLSDYVIDPGVLVIGLSPYNNDVRQRGSCDNRISDSDSQWNGATWNVTDNTNTAIWNMEHGALDPLNYTDIAYSASFSLSDLVGCLSPDGSPIPLIEIDPGIVYEGTWYLSKSIPINPDNETEGEQVQYQKTCPFQIHQYGNGMDSILYASQHVRVKAKLLTTGCTDSGNVALMVQTCIEKGEGHQLLNIASILNSTTVLSGDFNILEYNSPSSRIGCNMGSSTSECCQKWTISGSNPTTSPPFSGEIKVKWSMGNNDTDLNPDNDYVYIILQVLILNECEDFTAIFVDDNINGHIQLYKDPYYTEEYEQGVSSPFLDCHRAYAALLLAIHPESCELFLGTIINITLVNYLEDENTGAEEILSSFLIYDVEQPDLIATEEYDVIVETLPGSPCSPRVSWFIRKTQSLHSKMKALVSWNVSHTNIGADAYHFVTSDSVEIMQEIEEEQQEREHFSSLAVEKYLQHLTNRKHKAIGKRYRSQHFDKSGTPASYVNDHLGVHSKLFKYLPSVVQHYKHYPLRKKMLQNMAKGRSDYQINVNDVRKHEPAASKNSEDFRSNLKTLQSTKLAIEGMKYDKINFKTDVGKASFAISCNYDSDWDPYNNECKNGGVYRWFSGARGHNSQLGFIVAFLILVGIILGGLVFVGCISLPSPHNSDPRETIGTIYHKSHNDDEYHHHHRNQKHKERHYNHQHQYHHHWRQSDDDVEVSFTQNGPATHRTNRGDVTHRTSKH